jgi:hypothetical protein
MTTSLVMGSKRPTWSTGRASRPERPKREGPSLAPPGQNDGPKQEGVEPMQENPPSFAAENDVALARMMGCAFLFGIACIVGLLVAIF